VKLKVYNYLVPIFIVKFLLLQMTRSEYEEYPFGDLGRGTTDGCLLQDHYGCYIRGAVIEEIKTTIPVKELTVM
jgi:hypothetical protein